MLLAELEIKIIPDEAELLRRRAHLRQTGKRLVLTNGCFDLLHRGHVSYLTRASAFGDCLWVLLNSDQSVRALKGPARPVNAEADRAYVMAGLQCVNGVYIFPDMRCTHLLETIRPDVYVKGGDYTRETLDPGERAALESVDAEIQFLSFVEGFSTTSILARQ